MLTMKNTARTGQGRLTLYVKGWATDKNKSTVSVWCSRSEIHTKIIDVKNMGKCDITSQLWNGQPFTL